ncbi:hypothetical protein IPG41_02515 [Candidatus Peregrinibacteria bacterium]|nr:MAG: hypothetical protein IPG41_02515 [Candidatus Peregrinibacteria bacterium]
MMDPFMQQAAHALQNFVRHPSSYSYQIHLLFQFIAKVGERHEALVGPIENLYQNRGTALVDLLNYAYVPLGKVLALHQADGRHSNQLT